MKLFFLFNRVRALNINKALHKQATRQLQQTKTPNLNAEHRLSPTN